MAFQNRDDDGGNETPPTGLTTDTLGKSLGYALRRAQLRTFDDFVRTLEPVNLRPAYYSLLAVIEENPGLNQSEASATLGIQRTNLVAMVDYLEGRGLIERRSAESDRRSYALHLTDSGKAVVGRARELHGAHEARLAQKLGPQGREQLLRLLQKLMD